MAQVTTITRPAGTVSVRVPAKINLQLSVGPLRADGYHDVVTVYHAVALFDEITVSAADRTSVEVTGEGVDSVPTGPTNLAVKAAAALAKATGRRFRGAAAGGPGPSGARGRPPASGVSPRASTAVKIEIRKRIPVAAGLAGGSADAAAALVACNELWRTGLQSSELAEIAAQLGSDVPFALAGGTAVGLGRGEQLTTALAAGSYDWVLAFGATGLATPDVYAACDRLRAARKSGDGTAAAKPPELSNELMAALRSGDPTELGPLLSNDLQPAALSLQPLLRRALAAGKEHGALGAIVSGSGPTCAFLASDAEAASELAVGITGAGVCRAVVQVTGPAPGACLVDSGIAT
ncbi:MAG TPA: 4-(cytidine 5'-diphospho)-2-C-methyl-D-erythritol kinase [Streptosporangiaceae bacterium]|nr:4-(cytidine 5'-diphospho)-2-C-methyl-D-erythritol kinase [Streptosporangiaceae bacterium]